MFTTNKWGLKKSLKLFQADGAFFLANHPHAILADEPGLGKTVQALAAASVLELRRVLVVCPASVRNGWRQEIEECGVTDIAFDVISYEQATRGYANTGHYDGLILDEAHYLKTADSQRTQAIFGKSGAARHPSIRARWALTGTPVLNRPRELWPILKCLHPGFAEVSWDFYAKRYCGAFHNGRELDTRGASNVEELARRLDGFMLRRRKEDVLDQLPAKIIRRVALKLPPNAQAHIDAAEREILDREARLSIAAEDTSSLGDLSKMLHATGWAKAPAVFDYVRELLETEDKVVVFFKHTDVGAALREEFLHIGYAPSLYQGGMGDGAKALAVANFKQPESRVFLGQIQAAGTGINGLQEVCSTVVFAELDWTPGVMEQAIDRLHRIGQKAGSVTAHLLHAPGTMESAVLGAQNAKGSVVGRLLGEDGWRA